MPRDETLSSSRYNHQGREHDGDVPSLDSFAPLNIVDAESSAKTRHRNQKAVKRRGCSACSDGLKRGLNTDQCYCCSRTALDDFMQQKMKAWQPVLPPQRITFILLASGIFFLVLGIVLVVSNQKIVECSFDYTKLTGSELMLKIDASKCTGPSSNGISGNIYLFYQLTNFYQNHRRYLKSRSDSQLRGKVYTTASDLNTQCDPRVTAPDGRILHPCGLSAAAVFTDEISVFEGDELTPVNLDETRETICWHSDLGAKFKNPSAEEMAKTSASVDYWLETQPYVSILHMDKLGVGRGVENSHFVVWMREAALPTFRKVYAKIETEHLSFPFFIKISNNTFDVQSFGGSKSVVVSQVSWTGGRNSFLGIAYVVVGSLCIVVFGVLLYCHMRNPRHLGDVSWLRKALYADS